MEEVITSVFLKLLVEIVFISDIDSGILLSFVLIFEISENWPSFGYVVDSVLNFVLLLFI